MTGLVQVNSQEKLRELLQEKLKGVIPKLRILKVQEQDNGHWTVAADTGQWGIGTLGCWILDKRQWDNVWKSRGGIVVNGVPREVPRPKPEGPQAPRVFGRGTSRGTAFTTIHPRLFHTFSFFLHPGPVRRDFLYCRQTQPAPREYHTQCYIVEVQTLVELNPNILVRHVERMVNG